MTLKLFRRLFALVALLLVVAGMAACGALNEGAEGPPLQPCPLAGMVDGQCGTITVPEDRADPDGRTIELHFAVIPAQSSIAEPDPVFMLAGGPGQAATEAYPLILQFFTILSQNRDVVLVDQRGAGQSNPLACPALRELPLNASGEQYERVLEECRERLAQEADLTQYITDIAMQDLDEVRQALGYEQINLIGTSYGSRAAIRYMQLFPENVRTAVLNAVAGPQLILQFQAPVDGQRALQMLIASYTRNVNEAQTYTQILSLAGFMPALFLSILPIRDQAWMYFVPTIGQVFLVQKVMRGEALPPVDVAISVGITFLIAVAALLAAIRLYEQEDIVLGA